MSKKVALTAFSRVGCGLEYDGKSDGCEILHVLASIQVALGQQARTRGHPTSYMLFTHFLVT